MRETLSHLVARTIERQDAVKFLFILNQIDTAAGEDNPEAVVAAWQRALAQKGLTAGRFYAIYNEEVSVPIVDDTVRKRFQSKRDTDLADIYERIHQVEVERSYRIIGALDHIASDIEKMMLHHQIVTEQSLAVLVSLLQRFHWGDLQVPCLWEHMKPKEIGISLESADNSIVSMKGGGIDFNSVTTVSQK